MSLDKLKKTLEGNTKSAIPDQTIWAEVTEVDWEEKTMTVVGVNDDLEYYDVILGIGSIYYKPKKGSSVLIGIIENNTTTPFLIYAEEVESYEVNVGKSTLKIEDGFLLKKQDETLAKLMSDLLKEIQKMKFTTNAGPTILLINKPQFLAIENRFKQFLKTN